MAFVSSASPSNYIPPPSRGKCAPAAEKRLSGAPQAAGAFFSLCSRVLFRVFSARAEHTHALPPPSRSLNRF
jgi:hypothetical protein